MPFILNGEDDELLNYFEEVRSTYFEIKAQVLEEYIILLQTWIDFKDIEDQKTFALSIKNKTKFTGLLFQLRKEYDKSQTVQSLKKIWRESSDLILKVLFK